MAGLGTDLHEKELSKFVEDLESQGYRVIKLNGKSPDGVAVRMNDGNLEVSAVEALSSHYRKGKGWKKRFTYVQKRKNYEMFDDVLIHVFKMDPNVSKSSYCNFQRCRQTEIQKLEVMDNELYFCETHKNTFEEAALDDKSDFVYWCMDNLKKSIFRVLDK